VLRAGQLFTRVGTWFEPTASRDMRLAPCAFFFDWRLRAFSTHHALTTAHIAARCAGCRTPCLANAHLRPTQTRAVTFHASVHSAWPTVNTRPTTPAQAGVKPGIRIPRCARTAHTRFAFLSYACRINGTRLWRRLASTRTHPRFVHRTRTLQHAAVLLPTRGARRHHPLPASPYLRLYTYHTSPTLRVPRYTMVGSLPPAVPYLCHYHAFLLYHQTIYL